MKKQRLSHLPIGCIFYYTFDYYRIDSKNGKSVFCTCVIDGAKDEFPSSMFVEPLPEREALEVVEMAERGSGARR